MNTPEKVRLLSEAGRYDSCGPKSCEVKVSEALGGVYTAKAERSDCRLFKTLMHNSCSFDCAYCGNSTTCRKKKEKASYTPKELAGVFSFMTEKLSVGGLFISSGVAGDPDRVTEEMIEAVRIIRREQGFRGYVHFKVLPGTSRELIRQASEMSNRMSINIEAASEGALSELSSCKSYGSDILRRQRWISRLPLRSGQTTQVIVNGLSTDRDMLRMARWEYENVGLRRVYFSAFRPVSGTPLEKEEAEPSWRQNVLYNSDFLMRDYGYTMKDFLSVMDGGMLPRGDPKAEIARATMDGPLEIDGATYGDLIRVPGIGPRTARRILGRKGRIKSMSDLRSLGGWTRRAAPFIKIRGRRQSSLGDFYS